MKHGMWFISLLLHICIEEAINEFTTRKKYAIKINEKFFLYIVRFTGDIVLITGTEENLRCINYLQITVKCSKEI